MPTTLDYARRYLAAGLSVIPVALGGTKGPAAGLLTAVFNENTGQATRTWKTYQGRLATDAELVRWFGGDRPAAGIALVCGAVSGGLECLDLDDRETAAAYLAAVRADAPELLPRLTLEDTPNGVHVWYRAGTVPGNTKLAGRPDGLGDDGRPRVKTLIETRGEGGYAIVEGSPPAVHASGRPYVHAGGPRLEAVEPVTAAEHDLLVRTAKSFDRADDRHRHGATPPSAGPARPGPVGPADGGLSPGDDYDLRGPAFDELLPDARFSAPGKDAGTVRRPGKERGVSGTVGHCRGSRGEPLLKVFTSNWHPFEPDKTYGRFQVLRLTRFEGDGSKATGWLRSQGFGSPREPRPAAGGGAGAPTPAQKAPAEPTEWPTPIPLEDESEEVPPFPVGLLPPLVAELVAAEAESIYCPPDYPAVACLAAASGAIGAALAVEIKPDFRQPASLYCCVVGDPSAKKSPPLKHMLRPLFAEQAARVERLKTVPGHDDPNQLYPDGEGELIVSDVTVERLAEMLLRQPRGLLLFRPEMVGWLASQNQYKAKGAGADRPFFLEVYDSDPITVHRKNMGQGGMHVSHPQLAMLGATQPDVLSEFHTKYDGLAERICFAFPPPLPARGERWLTVPDRLTGGWKTALGRLWKLPMRELEGVRRPVPTVMPLSAAARPAWQAYTDRLAAEINGADFPPQLRGTYGKLEGTAARLALVLQILHQACDGHDPDCSGAEIAPRWVEAGGALAMYFGAHARKVRRVCGRDDRLPGAKRVLRWVADWAGQRRDAGQPLRFTQADAWASLRNNQLFKKSEDLVPPLRLLQRHNCVRWVPPDDRPGPGRPPSPGYLVNPALLVHERG